MNTVQDVIYRRRSIRIFERKKISKEIIVELLKAAMAAPSASNSRPWEFVVVTDEVKLAALRDKLKYGKYHTPVAIVVCGNLSIAKNEAAYKFWIQDCSVASENLLIAATSMGLGTVWIGGFPNEDVVKTLRETLGIPDDIFPLNIIYVGFPGEEKEPRTQFEDSRVHWDKY